jgi:hypothetical protein
MGSNTGKSRAAKASAASTASVWFDCQFSLAAPTEADQFMKCPGWGEWFDMRDLGQVRAHIHDEEIDISESFHWVLQTQFSRDCPGIALCCGASQHIF